MQLGLALSLTMIAACGGEVVTASPDAGPSPERDAGTIAPPDTGTIGPSDTGIEAGPSVGPLAGLPSAPGPHVAEIEALGAGAWIELERPAADPAWGTARGRSWGGRAFVLAPPLRGAFFYGEGVHAFVKPDGHAMDDLWFYDIPANRWIAVYPGTDTATFNDRVAAGELFIDDNGQLAEPGGGLVPVHVLIHAWDFLTYDVDRDRFAFLAGHGLGRYYLPGADAVDEGVTMLEAQREERPPAEMSPWYYDPYEGIFTRERSAGGRSDVGGYSAFVYVPSLGGFLNAGSQGVQIYDPEANAWSRVEDTGPRPPGYDHGVCYDPVRNRIYMGPGDNSGGVYIYDIESRTWSLTEAAGGPAGFRTNDASVFYDDANDVVVVFQYDDGTVYVYEPEADAWSSAPMSADVTAVRGSHNAFYDPVLNAYFVYVARDSADDGRMWVYRYR